MSGAACAPFHTAVLGTQLTRTFDTLLALPNSQAVKSPTTVGMFGLLRESHIK
jgi:hypothetical protein